MRFRIIEVAALSIVSVSSAVAADVAAQSGASAGNELEEVIVTAEKREANEQKTSLSIEVKTGEQLREEGKKRIDEIMQGTVGVAAQDSQVGVSFIIRGVASSDVGSTLAGSIPVIIDGVTQSRSETVRGGTLDLGRAEVLRGPQGTNLGSGSLAGAVNLVTNNPVFKYEGRASLELGNYRNIATEGVVNVPLSDTTALRFAASTTKRDGYISAGIGDSDLTNVRLKYRWQATDNLNIVLTGSVNRIGGDGVQQDVLLSTGHWALYSAGPGQPPLSGECGLPPGNRYSGCPVNFYVVQDGVDFRHRKDAWNDGFPSNGFTNGPYRHTDIDTASAQVDWTFHAGTLSILPSFQHSHFTSNEQWRNGSALDNNQTQDDSQLDVRFDSPSDQKLVWELGTYYNNNSRPGDFIGVTAPGAAFVAGPCIGTQTCYAWQHTADNRQLTLSEYGDFKFTVIDNWRLIGGLRHTSDKITYLTNFFPGFGVPGTIQGPSIPYVYYPAPSQNTFSDTTYRAGFEWDVLPQTMAYAAYSTAYQPGTVGFNGPPTFSPTVTAQKLTLDEITLGLKNRFLHNKLQVNLEAFHEVFHNRGIEGGLTTFLPGSLAAASPNCGALGAPPGAVVRPTVSADATCYSLNGATAPNLISQGIDLDVSFLPTSHDRIDVQLEKLDAKINARPQVNAADYTPALILQQIVAASPTATAANQQALAARVDQLFGTLGHSRLQNAPEFSFNMTYSHRFGLPNGSSFTPRTNVVYKTKYWSSGQAGGLDVTYALSNTTNLAWQPAYWAFDLYGIWETADGKFSVTGYVKNLSNEIILQNYTGPTVSLAPPRMWGAIFAGHF